jgi:hypothetical protein
MSTGFVQSRKQRGARIAKPRHSPLGSAREICVLGVGSRGTPAGWNPGARVAWSGRDYQVKARSPGYVYLTSPTPSEQSTS